MPASDLVLNVRQLAGYPDAGQAFTSDSVLLQRGLGGPYLSISPADLVGTALSQGGSMAIGGQVSALAVQAGAGQFSNLATGLFSAQKACLVEMDAQWGSIAGVPIATQNDLSAVDAALRASTVWTFNGRRGDVRLSWSDVWCVGGAPIFSPRFEGQPRAETPAPWSNGTRLATTGFVHRNSVEYITNLLRDHPFVFSFNGRTGDVTLLPGDVQGAEAALLNSPALTGTPTAPTAPPLTNNDQLGTTAYVDAAVAASAVTINTTISGLSDIYAPINSPAFTGYATAPTALPGSSNAQLATTAFVMNAVQNATAGVATFNGRTGIVQLLGTDITDAGGALLNSPVFTGTPQAPTAAAGNNSNQIATTAWVLNELGGANVGVMTFNGRGGAVTLTTTDIVDAGGAPSASPALTGVPTAPTAATGTATDQLATTAFVEAAITASVGGVSSFNGREGAVTLTMNDISAAGGAPISSPGFAGTPTAPTASAGTSTTQLATTAFVMAAIAAVSGVTTFNGRSGAVTLSSTDVNATTAGGPYAALAGATFTGGVTALQFTSSGAIYANNGIFPAYSQATDFYLAQQGTIRILNWGANWYDAWDTSSGNRLMVSGGNQTHIFAPNGNLSITGTLTTGGSINGPNGTIGGVSLVGGSMSGITNINNATVGSIGGVTFQGSGNFVTAGTFTTNTLSAITVNVTGTTTTAQINVPGAFLAGGGNLLPSSNNGNSCGVAGQAWFQCAAYNFAQQSSPDVKRDIATAPPGALRHVNRIPVREFHWQDDPPNAPLHTGWLASEVQAEFPPGAFDDGKAVNLGPMLAELWQAVQELSAQVATLKARPA